MLSVFYDLETTDTLFLGQILNYSFIAVDEDFKIHSELSGLIKVSRLQLPTPGAILANRVNILNHQMEATDSEKVAARKIVDYLWSILREAGSDVRLIGYNSHRFDLPFLRTTIFRNGLNPFIKNGTGDTAPKILNGDLLHLARKLVTSNEEFALISLAEDPESGELKRALTLQHLSQQLGLLTGVQSHESREDVLLTIELARTLKNRFGHDIRDFKPYEGTPFHPSIRKGEIFLQRSPEYDTSSGNSYSVTPMTLLDYTNSGALWIDLIRYQEGRGKESVVWKNTNDGCFFIEPSSLEIATEYRESAQNAVAELSSVSLRNYFSKSKCDIEQDIYRLDFDARDAIRDAIWKGDSSRGKSNPDVKTIMARHKLAHYEWGGAYDAKVEEMLNEYGIYRYGGKAIVQKSYQGEDDDELQSHLHPTFSTYMSELYERKANGSPEDVELCEALESFYLESDLFRLCGKELLPKR